MSLRHAPVLAFALALSSSAWAFVWPDVAERVEHDLSASDPVARRSAARDLASLGAARGGPLAIRALEDPDTEVRLAAADAAVRLHAIGATDIVAGWLNAPDARLRRKACEVARALPSPRAVPPLARTLGDPDADVRLAAADALGHQASGDAVPPLLGRLDDSAPAVRIQIVAALARLGDVRAVVPLVGKVQDSSPEVREAVARALGDLGDARASSALVLALRDTNADVRRDTLAALGRMRAADAVDAIAPFVRDRAPSLRLSAIAALGRIASTEAVSVLVGSLGVGDDASATLDRTAVRDALIAAGPAAISPLRATLESTPSAAAAASAAWVLGELHDRADAPRIVAAMRRGVLPTAAALHALAGAGGPTEVPVVLEFVADASPAVRGEALGTAAALLDPNRPDGRAVEPLAAVLRDARPSAAERARIARLLGQTGAPRAAPLLVDLLNARDRTLRLAAIDALGTLGPSLAVATDGNPAGSYGPVDDALLEALGSPDATVRLHAAMALAEAGGARARDALVAQLDGGDEVDRAAVLTGLGGVLARVPTDGAVAKLAQTLPLAAGPERDGMIEALGRAPLPSAMAVLEAFSRSDEPADRRATATLLPSHASNPRTRETALAVARALLADVDASVRAQAAWALGALGEAADLPRLASLVATGGAEAARDSSVTAADVEADAAAATGRLAARLHQPQEATRGLCPLIDRASRAPAYVRANALAGLALAGARCGDGSSERRTLAEDPSEDARASAALLVSRAPAAEDTRALERCARGDSSSFVAARCRTRQPAPVRSHATLVYVVAEGAAAPRPASAYAMLLSDGTVHVGTTDRRGAVFDPAAPGGDLTLRKPSAFAR